MIPNRKPRKPDPMVSFPPPRRARKVDDGVRTSLLLIAGGVVGAAGLAAGYVALRAAWQLMQLGITALGG